MVHGVSFQERTKIYESLKPHLVDHSREGEVSFGFGKIFFGRNKPHVWIPPNKSIVLEIRASELAKTSEQFTDYTFRFPRINNVRRDKIWEESCTLKEFQEMYKSEDGRVMKVVMRNVKKSDIISQSRKRKAKASVKFEDDDVEEIKVIDNVLEGKEFCVLNGPSEESSEKPSINDMKRMVQQHGGMITALPRNGKTFGIIVGRKTRIIQTYIDRKVFNIIKADWLVKHFGGTEEQVYKEMPKIRPIIDLIYATDDMKDSFKELYDDYGDSFTEHFETTDELKEFVDNMNVDGNDIDMSELDDEMVRQGFMNINFFRNVSAAFLPIRDNHFLVHASKSAFRFHAGSVIELTDVKLHKKAVVIVDRHEDIEAIKKHLLDHSITGNDLVDFRWILESKSAREVLSKDRFMLF